MRQPIGTWDKRLEWFFRDAAAELGFHAGFQPDLQEAGRTTGMRIIAEPTYEQLRAARKWKEVSRALDKLDKRQQGLLEAAYSEARRDMPQNLARRHGISDAAANAAWRLLRARTQAGRETEAAVCQSTEEAIRAAHAAFWHHTKIFQRLDGKRPSCRARAQLYLADAGLIV